MEKARILIVEDEAIIAMEIENQLQSLGYEVTSIVDTGEKAIKKAEADKPDLMLMDIRIKGEMDGIDTAEVIRNRFGIPVIFSTAYLDHERIERAKITMPFGYVLKPIQERDLKVTLEMALYVTKVDEERRKNEEWFSTTLKSIGDAVISTDTKGKVTLMNPVAESLTGWNQKDAFGKPLKEIFHIINEETRNLVNNPVENVIRTGNIVGLANHTILVSKDGREIPIDDSGSPIRNDKGEINGVVLVFRDISERHKAEKALKESESRVRTKLNAVLSPEGDVGLLNLADIIDVQEIQSMMDDFYNITNLAIGILDINGTVLVANGWQDICVKFHRDHLETNKHCIESDTELSKDVRQGEFKLYKCKNNLWDMSTPIIIGGKHLGNIFFGQFFFDDETKDKKFFISQAQKYGFNQKDYLEALDKVPQMNRKTVDNTMSFYSKFATKVAELGYSNIKLARKLNKNGKIEEN